MSLLLGIGVDDKANPKLVELDKNLKKLGRTANSVGSIIKGVLGAKLISQGAESIKRAFQAMGAEMLKYEDTLKAIEGITLATADTMDKMHTTIGKVTNATEHMGSAAAAAGLSLNKMGLTAKETSKVLPSVANLATASIVGFDDAARVTLQTLKSFSLEISEVDRVVNTIQGTVTRTSINFEDMAEALKFTAPIAKTLGIQMEETSAQIGILGNAGLRGSIGGTALKNTMLNLLKPGKKVAAVIKEMGDEAGTLTDLLEELGKRQFSINDLQQTFNKRALPGVLIMIDNIKQVKELTERLKEQAITAEDVAAVMRQSFNKQLLILKNNLFFIADEFIIAASGAENFEEAFSGIKDVLQDTQKWIKANTDQIQLFVQNAARLAKVIGIGVAKALEFAVIHHKALFNIMEAILAIGFAASLHGGILLINKALILLSANPVVAVITASIVALNFALDKFEDRTLALQEQAAKAVDLTLSGVQTKFDALMQFRKFLLGYEKAEEHVLSLQNISERSRQNSLDLLTRTLDKQRTFLAEATGFSEQFFNFQKGTGKFKGLGVIDAIDNQIQAIATQISKLERLKADDKVEEKKKDVAVISTAELLKTLLIEGEREKAAEKAARAAEKQAKKDEIRESDKRVRENTERMTDRLVRAIRLNTINQTAIPNTIFDLLLNKGISPLTQVFKDIDQTFRILDDTVTTLVTGLKASPFTTTPGGIRPSIADIFASGVQIPQIGSAFTSAQIQTEGGRERTFGGTADIRVDFDIFDRDFNKHLDQTKFEIDVTVAQIKLDTGKIKVPGFSEFADSSVVFFEELTSIFEAGTTLITDKVMGNIELYVGFVQQAMGSVFDLFAAGNKERDDFHSKELKKIEIERDARIKAAAGSKASEFIIIKQFAEKEKALLQKKEDEETSRRRREKVQALSMAFINIALGVTKALSGLRFGTAIAIATAGALEIAVISAQSFRQGGSVRANGSTGSSDPFRAGRFVTGFGNASSDSIPAFLSNGEFVIDSPQVSELGGPAGVERLIDSEVSRGFGSGGGDINVYIENAFDSEEIIREQYIQIGREELRWEATT